MNNIHSFKGLGVALITPFKEDKSIDKQALENIVDLLIAAKVNYLVLLGTTAETPTLTLQEKHEVVRLVVQKNGGRIPLMVGMSDNGTDRLLEDIRTFNFEGVDAILSSPPFYNKPSQRGIVAHLSAVADVSPVPVMLYNVPGRVGINMSVSTVISLAKHANVFGIKEASGDINHMGNIIKATHELDSFLVVSGDDGLSLPMIALGGVGVISVLANAYPNDWARMIQFARDGEFALARPLHFKYLQVIEALFEDGNPSGIKALMSEMKLCKNIVRLPLVPVHETTQNKLAQWCARIN